MPPLLPLLLALLVPRLRAELTMRAPVLVREPPPRVTYAARAGVRLTCAARADPPPDITWLADDGAVLRDLPPHRRIYNNGTLEILATSAHAAAAQTTVRCRAANAHGVTLSRDVTLVPVGEAAWEAAARAADAAAGAVAAVHCGAADPLVRAELWYRGDALLHLDPPAPESRYLVAGNTLLIREAGAADAGAYSCLARHALTGAARRARPATLSVRGAGPASAPRLLAAPAELSVPAGQLVCLPCVASDHPPPQYTYALSIMLIHDQNA
ncbi:cell adhesion molecule Dscam2-like [Helicoverpa armigera]|uniref:cell adhesion molecule Dscam2-like n=1 Tax=Helicoverpa armigera TaxID=29058 RepID=UPI0021125909|nr:Down syndrome cell adhesion molecule-like protein Dscam2 [Helicoverpa armigera]XP_049692152.1 Down syndrome cell adhesion molecule-like protein Dscam2 [Helicoverpa armigera]XP_049692153.1 Down syndrome cell adhesion molecule-like protein Dscam2 [Helicoverpa armigera]XP_049692154.1 Down syndrome cell adhesion molecule-like protein Dscam2 [Helicoverpa armigera]